jgi:MFS family permease
LIHTDTQSIATIAGIAQQFTIVLGYIINALLMPHLGPYRTNALALLICVVACLIYGFVSVYNRAFFWVALEIMGVGFGMVGPSYQAIVSMHVTQKHQGKLQSVYLIVSLVSIAIGSVIFSKYLFDAKKRGLAAGTPFFAAGICITISLLMFLAISGCATRKGRAEAAEEAAAEVGAGGAPVAVVAQKC